MGKTHATIFICQQCGASSSRWSGKCVNCGEWNSMIEETSRESIQVRGHAIKPTNITKLTNIESSKRLDTGIEEVNRVFGGGVVPGSVTLLAGEPGIGKSTLLLQFASEMSKADRVLYVSGEESATQIHMRANRLNLRPKSLELISSTNIDDVVQTIQNEKYAFVIVDSVQTMATDAVSSGAGSVSQITACAHILQKVAKNTSCSILIVGHVTKEGNIAGPKVLEHLVDVVLYLEGERFGAFKILRGIKNRFGAIDEIGIFEMQEEGMVPVSNPSTALLNERSPGEGSVVFPAIEGSRSILVEIQALVVPTSFGYPKRTSVGFDLNRMNMILAVLSKRANLDLSSYDVYVNIVGGLKIIEPAVDLAVALALASAKTRKSVLDSTIVFGEVGLNGEIRSVPLLEKRLKEANNTGFDKAIVPYRSISNSKLIKVANISDAVKKGLS